MGVTIIMVLINNNDPISKKPQPIFGITLSTSSCTIEYDMNICIAQVTTHNIICDNIFPEQKLLLAA